MALSAATGAEWSVWINLRLEPPFPAKGRVVVWYSRRNVFSVAPAKAGAMDGKVRWEK
jgi:hypothetical protein